MSNITYVLDRYQEDGASLEWSLEANCAIPGIEPDTFFQTRAAEARQAARLCDRCPVFRQCREYAESAGIEYGIWAGKRYYPRGRRDGVRSKPIAI